MTDFGMILCNDWTPRWSNFISLQQLAAYAVYAALALTHHLSSLLRGWTNGHSVLLHT